ncbi:MAG: thioredoxin domain-containing protein [Desulfobacterales bacterium]|nr:MAG: thioredoxin domain-containing protein [Desulfobacterales bacterium]
MLEKNPTTLKIVFKNFPLRSHKYATTAAVAALAAGRQGKFWEFHDELFRIYNQISDEKILEIAQKLALNLVQFEKDVKDPAIRQIIGQDYQEGLRIGVKGIPSTYINGKQLRARTLDDFQSAIDKELKKSPAN